MTIELCGIQEKNTIRCMRIADYEQFNSKDCVPFQQLVYGGLCAGFGDTIIYINIIRHFYNVTSIPLNISRWTIRKGRDRSELYKEILSLFKLEHICKITDKPPTANIDHLNPLITQIIISKSIDFMRAPKHWKSFNSNLITYQYDAVSFNKLKKPSQNTLSEIYETAKGYEFCRLGKHLTLIENLELLARSKCFIGIDSGISQLAYSVGVPMFLMRSGFFFSPNHAPNMGRRAIIKNTGSELAVDLREYFETGRYDA